MLLITRMFDGHEMVATLMELAASFGIQCVVEVFDERDLAVARAAGACIIQVNNRDLDTLKTDLAVSERLIATRRSTELWISASGITRPSDLAHVRNLGYDAALVGTFLMEGGDPEGALKHLLSDVRETEA